LKPKKFTSHFVDHFPHEWVLWIFLVSVLTIFCRFEKFHFIYFPLTITKKYFFYISETITDFGTQVFQAKFVMSFMDDPFNEWILQSIYKGRTENYNNLTTITITTTSTYLTTRFFFTFLRTKQSIQVKGVSYLQQSVYPWLWFSDARKTTEKEEKDLRSGFGKGLKGFLTWFGVLWKYRWKFFFHSEKQMTLRSDFYRCLVTLLLGIFTLVQGTYRNCTLTSFQKRLEQRHTLRYIKDQIYFTTIWMFVL